MALVRADGTETVAGDLRMMPCRVFRGGFLFLLCVAAISIERKGPSAAAWKPIKPEDFKMIAADTGDPGAEAAILFREGDLNDDAAEGTSLKVYVRLKIFTQAGRRYGDVQLPYRPGEVGISDVHARTVRPDGRAVDVESKDIFDKLVSRTSRGVWRAKTFSLPSVEVGSIIEYRYRQTYPSGFRYFAFDLQSDLFIKELRYSIQPQSLSKLDVKWVTINGDDKRFAPVWNGSYQIKADNILPFRREPFMPPESAVKTWGWLYYSKESQDDVDKYWIEYGRRVYAAAREETKPTKLIRRVVHSITVSTDTPREKIERIYEYVQREIENFSSAPEAHDARDSEKIAPNNSADLTIKRRRGTARDINRLFIAMVRAAGLNAHVAELTTRDENFFHSYFTDSSQFNSEMTAVVAQDGSIRFFDPAAENCPAGIVPWEKESVAALVYGKHNPRFVNTPISQGWDNAEERLLTVAPTESGELRIHEEDSFKGQRALEQRNTWSDLSEEGLRRLVASEYIEAFTSGAVNEATLKIDDRNHSSKPLSIICDYTAAGGAQLTEKRLILGVRQLIRSKAPVFTAPRRYNDIYFHYPCAEHQRITIEPMDGYEAEELPKPVEVDIGAAHYRAVFSRAGNRVVFDRTLLLNAITFTAESYQNIKDFFDRVNEADGAPVTFKRTQ